MISSHWKQSVSAALGIGLPIVFTWWLAQPSYADDHFVNIDSHSSRATVGSLERSMLRIDINVVLVPVTVTDAMERPVMALSQNSFRLFEDDVEQKVLSFHREDGPVSVGFVLDLSGSMKQRIGPSFAAIQQFITTLVPEDEYFLATFNDRAALVQQFTRNPEDILRPLSSIQPDGWTAMNDAVYLGLNEMKRAENARRALIVLTDGGNNHSRYSDSEVRLLAQESDVRIYSIGILERPHFLEKLALDTGGKVFSVSKLDQLPETIDKLSRTLRNTYVLGYAPTTRSRDGKYRRVRVEVVQTAAGLPLHLSWRRGYYSPLK
jgi:VWFA-related protein